MSEVLESLLIELSWVLVTIGWISVEASLCLIVADICVTVDVQLITRGYNWSTKSFLSQDRTRCDKEACAREDKLEKSIDKEDKAEAYSLRRIIPKMVRSKAWLTMLVKVSERKLVKFRGVTVEVKTLTPSEAAR